MFQSIAGYMILGIPFVIYMGIITFLCLIFAATISILNKRRIRVIPMKWHSRVAYVTIGFGLCHGLLIFLSQLGL
jgi:hypothetical protein